MTVARVTLWGTDVGAVSLAADSAIPQFEYAPDFVDRGVEIAPVMMPLRAGRQYRFPTHAGTSFQGLPGLLADALPDRFGRALIDAWLARQGREAKDFDAIERLSYVGKRGMGALEFEPATGPKPTTSHRLEVEALAKLAAAVLAGRESLSTSLAGGREAMREILRVGSSAGGARAKALIAYDPETGEVRSGQLEADPRFEYWILKFDGVDDATRDFGNARGYGVVEWIYSEMAREAGIQMTECRLLEEGGRRHFMTKRFDRDLTGTKQHMQSLAAILHLDFELVGAHSYEQAFQVIRQLDLPQSAVVEQFRRMVFNVVARNQDDHVKNIAFLMNRDAIWSLSPAYDMVYAHNPEPGRNTRRHQMSINGKTDEFSMNDLIEVGELTNLKRTQAKEILEQVIAAVATWPQRAAEEGLDPSRVRRIGNDHRLSLPRR